MLVSIRCFFFAVFECVYFHHNSHHLFDKFSYCLESICWHSIWLLVSINVDIFVANEPTFLFFLLNFTFHFSSIRVCITFIIYEFISRIISMCKYIDAVRYDEMLACLFHVILLRCSFSVWFQCFFVQLIILLFLARTSGFAFNIQYFFVKLNIALDYQFNCK